MPNCGVCSVSNEPLKSFDDFVGVPPIPLSELIIKCTRGTKCKYILHGICNTCTEDLLCFYESVLAAKMIRHKILGLLENQIAYQEASKWSDVDKLIEVVTDTIVSEEHCTESSEMSVKGELMEDSNSQNMFSDYEEKLSQEDYSTDERIQDDEDEMNEDNEEEGFLTNAAAELSDTEDEGDDIQKGCAECGAVFDDLISWKLHKREKHKRGFMCDQCGKILRTRDGLVMHLKTHDPNKPLSCHICGKRYHFEIHLKNHMAWHTGEKKYECKICNKRFVNYGLLANHKIIHKELPAGIECNICGKKFRQRCRLNQHMTIHSKEKPYSCDYCGYRFSSKYHVTAHVKYNKKCSQLFKTQKTIDDLKDIVKQETKNQIQCV